jgi:hypothetical protein
MTAAAVDLEVIVPSVDRDAVESARETGMVASPYRFYEATARISRSVVADRTEDYVVAVDRSRRLTLRADTVPETEARQFEDALVLPTAVTDAECRELAEEAVFEWAMRSSLLHSKPAIELGAPLDAYKLFWLAERESGDVIVDSVDGTERPFED